MHGEPNISGAPTPRNAEDDAAIDQLIDKIVPRIATIFRDFTKPSAFSPPDEQPVVITSWMKSGTTLTQQLVYQLLVQAGRVPTDPSGTDFEDISSVVPLLELTKAGGPVESVHPYRPTVWKTHSLPTEFLTPAYANARFLVAVRRGRPVMRSYADFASEWVNDAPIPPELQPAFYERFFRAFFLRCPDCGRGAPPINPVQWFAHVRDWRDAKDLRDRMLFLIYEDVVRDLPGTVRTVARFLNLPVSEETVAEVARRCQKENMAGDPRFLDKLVARATGLSEKGGVRVRADGQPGGFRDVLTERTAEDYQRMFEAAFGMKSYEELKEQLRERNREVLRSSGSTS